jgi:hypothetical protein
MRGTAPGGTASLNFEQIKQQLHALYIDPNPYRNWAWALSVLVLFMFPRPTRRLATILFLVGLFSMGIFFGMMSIYKQYTPQ